MFLQYLELFNAGEYGNITDRLETKHEDTVDCIVALSDGNFLVTGSLDGSIQLNHICPNMTLNQIGSHDDGVEELVYRSSDDLVFSCGQDGNICVWNIAELLANYSDITASDSNGKELKKARKAVKLNVGFFDELL